MRVEEKKKMDESPRTDMAIEAFDGLDGTKMGKATEFFTDSGSIRVDEITILSADAEKRLGRRKGRYVTFLFPHVSLMSDSAEIFLSKLLSQEIEKFLQKLSFEKTQELKVLVIGIGNRDMTADAIGPLSADKVIATRHLEQYDKSFFDLPNMKKISVFSPSVEGKTGIETELLVREVAGIVKPDVILAIDALATLSCDSIGSTLQITDSGISPGSSVGNRRAVFSEKTLGAPVIAIGVPMVVDSSVLIEEALKRAEIDMPPRLCSEISRRKRFFVCPKDSDLIVERLTEIISSAINRTFTEL